MVHYLLKIFWTNKIGSDFFWTTYQKFYIDTVWDWEALTITFGRDFISNQSQHLKLKAQTPLENLKEVILKHTT